MKNYYLSFLAIVFTIQSMAQVTPKYHLVRALSEDATSVANYCNNGVLPTTFQLDLNIYLETKLPVNTVFIADLQSSGSYRKYYVVVESGDSPSSNPIETITNFANSCEIVDFCNVPLKTYKGHRFYYLGSTISGIESKYCQYLQNPPSSGIKVNVFNTIPLKQNSVYYYDGGEQGLSKGYYFIGYAGTTPNGDEDDNIHNVALLHPISFNDSDYDGVPNICDNCATQAGPPSNGGCPLPPAELSLDPVTTHVSSDCSTCPQYLSSLGSRRYEIVRNGGGMIMQARIRNTGQQSSGNYKIKVYLSSDATLSSGDFNFYSSTVSASSINAGTVKIENITVYGSQFEYNQAYGNYYILIVLDADNNVTEANENNNLTAVPILFKQNF
ncbi:CARDB domain-containing protein [Parapedobacter tibetensis]|uniref:CARDB domain-containing protein n=1 Tax=Parapedobacter tibetensis TaxID=2972951 RepID=UPI00214DCDB2|nr:CARDB domain-containing protein [Parapedobacter tibetensis]